MRDDGTIGDNGIRSRTAVGRARGVALACALALGLAGCSSMPLPTLPSLGGGPTGGLSQAEQDAVIRDLSSAAATPAAVPPAADGTASPSPEGVASATAVVPPVPTGSLSPQR
jgi:hypothetical protein